MIEIAQEKSEAAKVENVKFECIGIDALTKKSEEPSYDSVLAMSILHLIPSKDRILEYVQKIIKPGGYFISSNICIREFAKYIGWFAPAFSWLCVIPKINIFTKEELKKIIEDCGLQIEREFQPAPDKGVFFVAKKI